MAQPISEVGQSPPIDVWFLRLRLNRDVARRFADDFEQPFHGKSNDDIALETFACLAGRELSNIGNRSRDMLEPLGDRWLYVRILRGYRRRFAVQSGVA